MRDDRPFISESGVRPTFENALSFAAVFDCFRATAMAEALPSGLDASTEATAMPTPSTERPPPPGAQRTESLTAQQ